MDIYKEGFPIDKCNEANIMHCTEREHKVAQGRVFLKE
jgi:hypothetical protein